MDEDLRFGIGVTTLICSVGYVIGELPALLACVAFCSIPWVLEIKNRRKNPKIQLIKCDLCGYRFKIRNKVMEYEYRILGNICPICIEKIFKHTKMGADELLDEEPVK